MDRVKAQANNNIALIDLYNLDSFSIRTLQPVLKEAGFNVHLVFFKNLNLNNTMDEPEEEEIEALINLLVKLDPFLIGVSVRSTLFKLAAKITRRVKERLAAPVIWGGVHPTVKPGQCLEFADIACVGEGEGAIRDLAVNLSQGKEIGGIQNLWVKKQTGVIKNGIRPLIEDLNFPLDFSDENKYFINNKEIGLPPPSLRLSYGIMTSKGCPFVCTYCSNSILSRIFQGRGRYIRRRSVDNVLEELARAREKYQNLAYISFYDDIFTFDRDWLADFCRKYKRDVRLPFYCLCHPNFVNEAVVGLLKDAGVKQVTMGIQHCQEVRHSYFERYHTDSDLLNAARILHRHKINANYEIIMDNPFETEKHKRQLFELLLKLPRPFQLFTHSINHFPETRLTERLLEAGLISENDVEDQKEKSYQKWTAMLDPSRPKENIFWESLYYMNQSKYFPRPLVVWLSRNKFIKGHPKLLNSFLRMFSPSIYTIRPGSKADIFRWYFISICNPKLWFDRKARYFLWGKIKRLFRSA